MKNIKMILEVNSNECLLNQSAFAVVDISPEFLRRLEELQSLCKQYALESVSVSASPDAWDNEDDLRPGEQSLLVTDTFFWFETWPKHSDTLMDTTLVNIECLSVLAKAGHGRSDEAGMLFEDGVLYCGNIPEELVDIYLDTLAPPPCEAVGGL